MLTELWQDQSCTCSWAVDRFNRLLHLLQRWAVLIQSLEEGRKEGRNQSIELINNQWLLQTSWIKVSHQWLLLISLKEINNDYCNNSLIYWLVINYQMSCYQKVAGSIPLVCMPKCPWANCSWCAVLARQPPPSVSHWNATCWSPPGPARCVLVLVCAGFSSRDFGQRSLINVNINRPDGDQ